MIVNIDGLQFNAVVSISAYKLLRKPKHAYKPNGITDNRLDWALKDEVKASVALKTVLHVYKTQEKHPLVTN